MKIIDSRSFEDVCLGKVTVMSGVRPFGRTTDHRRVGRQNHGILYVFSGEATFWCDNKRLVFKEGKLVFIPKNCRYKMQYSAPSNTIVVVNFDMFLKNGEDVTFSSEITVLAEETGSYRLANIVSRLELCGAAKGLAATLRRKELLYRLLGLAFESGLPNIADGNKYPQILAGVLLLEQNYLENLPVTKLAEACSISVSSFRSLFHKQYGMSPVQYRNNLRIERARVLLAEGSCTVGEAAYSCGFDNLGYFCRYYKRITGETPSRTRACGGGL